jgi:hypothetical protein
MLPMLVPARVRGSLVCKPWQRKYSSATNYYTNKKGLLQIALV